MASKMGRPKSDNPKVKQITVRFDSETLEKLDKVASSTEETRTQVIRRGIDVLYSELESK